MGDPGAYGNTGWASRSIEAEQMGQHELDRVLTFRLSSEITELFCISHTQEDTRPRQILVVYLLLPTSLP